MSDASDLELLESLQLRFAIANSLEQLQKLVSTLLIPLLDKLDDCSATVKAKVQFLSINLPPIIGLLGQVNKKLKGYPQATLPMGALLDTTLAKDVSAYSQSFRLIYITMAAERAENEQLATAIPVLLDGIRQRSFAQSRSLAVAMLTSAQRCETLTDEQLRNFKFADYPHRAEELLKLAINLLLFNPMLPSSEAGAPAVVVAGLSTSGQMVITNEGKAPWASDSDALKRLKVSIVRIVGSEQALPIEMADAVHEQRFLALLCGSCDPYFPQVASLCEDSLKRMRAANCESPTFVSGVLELFLGSSPETSADSRRQPVAPALKLKLFGYLNRSAAATAVFPQWLQVIFQSLFGQGASNKLRRQGMQFLHWAIRMAPQEQLTRAAPVLLQGVRKVLTEFTSSTGASIDGDIIRGSAYVAWGALAKRVPTLVTSDLSHLRELFEAFDAESANVRLSIQESLLAMLPAYESGQPLDETTGMQLLEFLQQQLTSSTVRQTRYCALRYAISAFPFACMEARWLCVLGLADSEREIRTLAQSGLAITPAMVSSGEYNRLPVLGEAIRFLHAQVVASTAATRLGAANPLIYSGVVGLGRSLIMASGIAACRGRTEAMLEPDVVDLEAVNEFGELATAVQRESVQTALSGLYASGRFADSPLSLWAEVAGFALAAPTLADSSTSLSQSLMCIIELLSLSPMDAALAFFAQRQKLKALLGARSPLVQQRGMQALSIVYATKLYSDARALGSVDVELWNGQTVAYLHELVAVVAAPAGDSRSLDDKQGSILALGHISHGLRVARLALGNCMSWAELGLNELGLALEKAQAVLLENIAAASKSTVHPMLASALCVAIGQIGKTGCLGASSLSVAEAAMAAVVGVAKSMGDAKVQDAAYSALANLALGSEELAAGFIEFLQASAKSATKKQIDVHFRIGEALAAALGRFQCTLVRVGWIFPIDPAAVYGEKGLEANAAAVDVLLEAVTGKMAMSASPQDRQAAVVWILSLVQFCPQLSALTPWLNKLHTCLCTLITDRDEFTQEAASKTLGLIYDMGDATLKDNLVYSLMSLFGGSGSGSTQQTVRQRIESDEPLLEQESLGQTPDGRAVNTTYKSILSLASDMQKPSLVYQFMQLATHTAVWSSRRGAAYGFATIIERARESMQPHLKAIVPKLYRYTFDPSPQTRAAMTSIWRALLGPGSSGSGGEEVGGAESASVSGTSVVETHWDDIMAECLSSMGQREWRVRESGCAALAGAVRGAKAELVVPFLERMWQMSFRALDDIKGSVREAGLKTCQALATATVAWCTPRDAREAARDKQALAVLSVVVPFLVDSGVVSDAEDVRGFSLGLLLKLCRASGSYLSASVPVIAERLLESLSNMESQSANYLTFHTESHNITQDQLEAARLGAVKASPIMQGIELVLDQLNPESMAELVPRLQTIVRRGLGLPTRAGCARTIVVLCVKRAELVHPHASALVKAISGSLTESSAVQRQAWAAAIGFMAPMLSSAVFRNLLKHLEKTYKDKYDDDVRGVCGLVLEQLALRCPERLRDDDEARPAASFVLLGCWDPSEPIRESFRCAWREFTLGSGSKLIEKHVDELLGLPLAFLGDDSWARRVQSVAAIADLTRSLERAARAQTEGDKAVQALATLADLVLPNLAQASQGRVWPGKAQVLECLVLVCAASAKTAEDDTMLHVVCDLLLREIPRGDLAYRRLAVTHFCALVESVPALDVYSEASTVLLDIITRGMGSSVAGMDLDTDEEPLHRPLQLLLIAAAVRALLMALPKTRVLVPEEAASAARVLCEIARDGIWNIRVASLECLQALVAHCCAGTQADSAGRMRALDMAKLLQAVGVCAAEGKYVAVRTAALGALEAVLDALKNDDPLAGLWGVARSTLDMLASDPVPSIADRAKDARAKLGKSEIRAPPPGF
ncbi:proteasome component M29 [Coemansia sp. BCRC 34301]|nr:proteasome component M29 [Coemansia sp. BCRC 34301]